jgi:deoxyribose-phosphate aldolase
MTKTQKTNRVDRLVERAKNHPVIAVIFILALVVFAVAKLADSEKAITDAWKR